MVDENRTRKKPPDVSVADEDQLAEEENPSEAVNDEVHKEVEDIFEEAQNLDYGREDLERKLREHTAERPSLSGGDIDADWEQADASEEVVGGENPVPDESVVEEEGAGVGLTYQDDEPLDAEAKVAKRDREPWELNPASSLDYQERLKEEFREPIPPLPREQAPKPQPPAKKAPAKQTKGPVKAKPKTRARSTRSAKKANGRNTRKRVAKRATASRR